MLIINIKPKFMTVHLGDQKLLKCFNLEWTPVTGKITSLNWVWKKHELLHLLFFRNVNFVLYLILGHSNRKNKFCTHSWFLNRLLLIMTKIPWLIFFRQIQNAIKEKTELNAIIFYHPFSFVSVHHQHVDMIDMYNTTETSSRRRKTNSTKIVLYELWNKLFFLILPCLLVGNYYAYDNIFLKNFCLF